MYIGTCGIENLYSVLLGSIRIYAPAVYRTYRHLRYTEPTKTHIVSFLHTHTHTHIRALALALACVLSPFLFLSSIHSRSLFLVRFFSLTLARSRTASQNIHYISNIQTHTYNTKHNTHAQMYRHMYTCTYDMQNGDTMELPVIITHTRMCIQMYTYTHV